MKTVIAIIVAVAASVAAASLITITIEANEQAASAAWQAEMDVLAAEYWAKQSR